MLDADGIIAQAERQVGIADTDSFVRENLAALLASMAASFPMSEQGAAQVRENLLLDTVNRLEGLKWLRDHPEIADERIEAPVFLCGLPRSGTTYFQYLFDRDPRFRQIRTWESIAPSPPPGHDPASVEPRREAWRERQRRRPHFAGFEALHLYDEDGTDECHAFLEQSFGAAGLHNLYRVPAWFDRLLDHADLAGTYRVHKRQLQLLQWEREPKRWALKYPNHIIAMDAVLSLHPEARFVMTHRDPVQALASICKMTFNLRAMRSAAPVDRSEVGQDMLHFITRHIERIMAFDAGPQAGTAIHVDYYALVADPVREMRAIHAALGIDTPDEVAAAVAEWHAANPKNARGRNDYALEEYGLDAAAARARFTPYIQRFAIPSEVEGIARNAERI